MHILSTVSTTDIDTGAVLTTYWIGALVGYALTALALTGIFKKAGEPAWAAWVPIYNTITLLKVAGKDWWWFLLLLIPFVNIVFLIIVLHALSTSFGHGVGFTIGLFFLSLIFLFVLGYNSDRYLGPGGVRAGAPAGAAA